MVRAFFCVLGLLTALAYTTPIMVPGKNVTSANIKISTGSSQFTKVGNGERQFTVETEPQTSVESVAVTATEMLARPPTELAEISTMMPTEIGNTTTPASVAIPAALGQGISPPLNLSALYEIIFSGKNVLTKNPKSGQLLEPNMPPGGLGVNMTGPSGPGGRIMEALFGRPLNYTQYYERNWMWIRCRAQMSTKFDVGGGWVREHGRNWFNFLNKQCVGIVNWKFDYANGQGWGDAQVSFDFFFPGCTIQHAVRAAMDASREVAEAERRELYVYSCPGFDSEPWSFKEMQRGQESYDPLYQNPSVLPALQQQQGWLGIKDPRAPA